MSMFEQLRGNVDVIDRPEPVVMSGEQAINAMDHVFALVIAMRVRKDRGEKIRFTRDHLTKALDNAKMGANVAHLLERGGNELNRQFSIPAWTPLIDEVGLLEVQRFSDSPYMHPSVCIRMISSISSIDM